MTEEQFRLLGHDLVDRIAGLLSSIRTRPVTPAESPLDVRAALAANRELPEERKDAGVLLRDATRLLFEHSLFNGWKLSPMATEMEGQVIRWLAQFIGYPEDCGGLLLSGGNMANLTCFLAARAAQAGWDIRKQGVAGGRPVRRVWCQPQPVSRDI